MTGADLSHVVQTHMFVTSIDGLEDVSRAHREAFADVMPATLVEVSRLAAPEMIVEIEADAVLEA